MYTHILELINQRLPDNEQMLITPEWMRANFADAVEALGSDANCMGLAQPNNALQDPTDLVTIPDHKQWYIATKPGTYTVGSSSIFVLSGEVWLFYCIGNAGWQAVRIEKAVIADTRGGRGSYVIDTRREIPNEPTPIYYPPLTGDVIHMTVDGEEVVVRDSIIFYDDDIHRVTIMLSDTYAERTPDNLFHGCSHVKVAIPDGIKTVTNMGGHISSLTISESVSVVEEGFVSGSGVGHLTMLGAPPAYQRATGSSARFDYEELCSLNVFSFPEKYRKLYERNADLQKVDTILSSSDKKFASELNKKFASDPWVFTQALASSRWSIVHPLNRIPTAIRLLNNNGDPFDLGEIRLMTSTELVIEFNQECSGTAIIS